MNQIKIFMFDLFNLSNVNGTYRVDLVMELQSNVHVVCKLCEFVCFVLIELLIYFIYRWPFWNCPVPN